MSGIIEPYLIGLDLRSGTLGSFTKRVVVELSDLKQLFHNREALDKMLSKASNPVIYEYCENTQPEAEGHLNFGITMINPGKIGSEYYMTRGHYHAKQHAAEIYVGIRGEGMVIMQTKEGQLTHSPIRRGDIVYIPSFWAHRTINTGRKKLTFLFVYPSDAGHDYGTIRQKGFAKLVVEKEGQPELIHNPRFTRS